MSRYLRDDQNSSEDDDDDIFLLNMALAIPSIRFYPDRPDLFNMFNDSQFRQRYRFSKENMVRIHEIISPYIEERTNHSKALSSMSQLLIAIRFLATGCFLMTEADIVKCHASTISRTLPVIIKKIAQLGNIFAIKMPSTREEFVKAKRDFFQIGGFPNVIGTIDCTHVKIQCPDRKVGEMYRNRKGYFSINVQCVASANLKILDIEARWPGSVHDQTILEASFINARLENNEFPSSYLLGDSGYALKKYLLTPLANPTTASQLRYQKSHLKTRNSIERMFGVWKRRFPALALGFRHKTETILACITAAAVLHNLAIELGDEVNDFSEVEDLNTSVNTNLEAIAGQTNQSYRDLVISNFFSSNIQ